MPFLLQLFLLLKGVKLIFELFLAYTNKKYFLDEKRQAQAISTLELTREDLDKSVRYSVDKYKFNFAHSIIGFFIFTFFLIFGGFGLLESWARDITNHLGNGSSIFFGLTFFALLGILSYLTSLPFEIYSIFYLEEKHGFNRQTFSGFIADQLKMMIISSLLGGIVLFLLLWVMEQKSAMWWFYAWTLLSGFSLLTSWLYPSLLAPLFNKFSALEEGPLRERIYRLAERVKFKAAGIFVMDASTRSSHGNAYFTGIFSQKRIVLFDTLTHLLNDDEIEAVLAHELGHFKLNHVRWAILRSILLTGLTLYGLSLLLPIESFYHAFYFSGVSNFAALIVFSLWFGPVDFILTPMISAISRSNEFAADHFAVTNIENKKHLRTALLKLREHSSSMPISHPLYSMVYHSHPPLIERLSAF